ncbi:TIM barrel protein [Ferrovibrio terrae]|uniref:bifunctional sugar phosphate isomerase/epimerase/4-hydroxyphenylpyruvate dioxygenase family protein n=1 Tax=Ferrovibrio terrae TaxID=2594003 RepID=UPI0031382685
MRRSIATVSLSGTLSEKLEAAAAARFHAVEIFENDLLFFNGSPRQVRGLAKDLGLEIVLFQPFRDFEGVSDAQLKRNLDRAEKKFDVMAELGAPLMLVCSNVAPDAIGDPERSAAQMYELAERAGKRGLKIGLEALAWGTHINTYGHAWQVVKTANHPHLGVVLDSFHTLALGDTPDAITDIPGNKIFFVQLADAPKLSMDILSWSRHFRCFPGQGDLDVTSFTLKALEAGYTGPLSLEIFNDDFRAASTRLTAVDGMRSLNYLEEQMRLRTQTATTAPTQSVARRVELFAAPQMPELKGIAFIEFAVDGPSKDALATMLTGLGFRRAGRHKSKNVTLYRQGETNIVLNAEPDSFAHSYYIVHGPSICAVCLQVDDEIQIQSRADAYQCTRYEGRIGPNERNIPAFRSLDGSLLYFVDQDFDFSTDFVLQDDGGENHVGVIDHIAQAVPSGQMDSWVLFYRSVLGLQPESIWVLPDPYGLVRSRAVRSANGAVRFPLSFSEDRNTATARSVSTFSGAGVHHIAFSTTDIFEAVASMREKGVSLLTIPANYYDDLSAKFPLADDVIERLRQHNVLYDRDTQGGEFFHVFTDTFDDRFFFEVCQRVGGYDQYGAANAPVRMAAQAQRRISEPLRSL